MENLKIVSNKVRLLINDDKDKVIEFNPANAKTKQKFYEVYDRIQKIGEELEKKLKETEKTKNVKAVLDLESEIFHKVAELTDELFGEGTTNKITDGDEELEIFIQFYKGIVPYFQKYNNQKASTYLNKSKGKSGVMK